jgi:hypothetical protein
MVADAYARDRRRPRAALPHRLRPRLPAPLADPLARSPGAPHAHVHHRPPGGGDDAHHQLPARPHVPRARVRALPLRQARRARRRLSAPTAATPSSSAHNHQFGTTCAASPSSSRSGAPAAATRPTAPRPPATACARTATPPTAAGPRRRAPLVHARPRHRRPRQDRGRQPLPQAVAHRLGYQVTQPYPAGGERHHVVFTESPIPVLERFNVIAKDRS